MGRFKIITGTSHPQFAQSVAEAAGVELSSIKVGRFADGEIQVEISESVRGHNVFIVQSTCPPVNEAYMELFIMIDALKRASARSITAVIPYYGYARQDRKVAPRAPISAKCMADLLSTAGAHRVVCVDLHAAQIQGFFNVPVDNLYAFPTMAAYWNQKYAPQEKDVVVISPDAGGVERTTNFAKRIQAPLAIIDKRRNRPNEAKAVNLIGDVTGQTAVIIDDIIDTAGTLTQAVDNLLSNGAKKVFAVATHALFSGPAIERLSQSRIEKVLVSDTVPLSEAARKCEKIEVISIASVVANAITRIDQEVSVSSLFN